MWKVRLRDGFKDSKRDQGSKDRSTLRSCVPSSGSGSWLQVANPGDAAGKWL